MQAQIHAHRHASEAVRPGAIVAGFVLAVIAPMAAAAWALANWWPLSGAVWLAATLLVWVALIGTATNASR